MLEAILRGKLSREQANMEDILTSNVFGLLKYLPLQEGLFPFLRQATTPENKRPLEDIQGNVKYEFWPLWSSGLAKERKCEPDVVIRVTTPERKVAVLVEAKFLRGKSSVADEREDAPPNDQLAREWGYLLRKEEKAAQHVLVYLTADVCMPQDEIAASIKAYCDKQPDSPGPVIAWLSWRHLVKVVEQSDDPIRCDLKKLLERMGLFFYRGITEVYPLPADVWAFVAPSPGFDWGAGVVSDPLPWRFQP